jgi:pimeloyl-ACP methyl ester carboxylesterase
MPEGMKNIQYRNLTPKIRRIMVIAATIAMILSPLSAAVAEKTNVFFIHGANVSEQDARAWAAEMFKGLYQAGANMEFYPVAWQSDIGPSYNYHINASNAFVTASFLAPRVNGVPGRKVVIAHSLGTMVAAAAIQDYGMQVDKLIMLNSAIPSEAFDPALADESPNNKLVHNDWISYTNSCWTSNWYKLFNASDARSRLTWRGRFAAVVPVAVNFYSSGDEVLELYPHSQNPAWYNGVSPSGNWGERYSWHKQEIWKGRKSLLGFIGTTEWSGWGFRENMLGVKKWSAQEANAIADAMVFSTNTVFNPYPASITNAVATRLETDSHLTQGIPALSPPTGRTKFRDELLQSFDMDGYRSDNWPTGNRDPELQHRWLHSDTKNVAFFFTHRLFEKIAEVGGLKND